MYREGIGTDKNSEKAFEYIKKAADLDNDNAQYCYDLSNLYDLQKEDTAILSFEYLKKAVEKDPTNPIYCYTLGTFYTKGVGTEKNNKEGLKYFKKAADFAGAEGIKFFPQIFEFFEDEDFINDSSNSEEVFAFLKKYSNLGISCTLSNKDGTKSVNLDDIDLETFRSFFKNDNQ